MKNIKNILLVLAGLTFSFEVFASSCCGQSAMGLNVLTQRQKLNASLSQSYSNAMGRVYDSDNAFYIWPESKKRILYSTNLSLAYSLSNKYQMFLNSGFQNAEFKDQQYSDRQQNMTDTLLGLTYEFLTEYKYNPYKPTGYVTLFTNLPSGHSVFDSDAGPESINVSGHDQWGLGLGLTLNKIILPWTFLVQVKSLRLFKNEFKNASVDGFFDSSSQFVIGYTVSAINAVLNLSLTQVELSGRDVRYQQLIQTPTSSSTVVGVGFIKPITDQFILSVNYSDQSLLGQPKNTLISQTLSLNLAMNYY